MSFWKTFLNLFYPPKCPFCGKVLDTPGICPKCEKTLPWTADAEAVKDLPGGICCAAPLWYEGAVRDAILGLKFQGSMQSAEPMGELIARCAAEHFSGEFDMVSWVPVSRRRLRERGYDQARLIAESACRLWDTKPVQLLEKSTHNAAQSGLAEPAARRANVLGVYEPRNVGKITGSRVLLVDDVCTSGATVAECVRVLRDFGAQNVVCVTLARTREQKKVHKNQTCQGCNHKKTPL